MGISNELPQAAHIFNLLNSSFFTWKFVQFIFIEILGSPNEQKGKYKTTTRNNTITLVYIHKKPFTYVCLLTHICIHVPTYLFKTIEILLYVRSYNWVFTHDTLS